MGVSVSHCSIFSAACVFRLEHARKRHERRRKSINYDRQPPRHGSPCLVPDLYAGLSLPGCSRRRASACHESAISDADVAAVSAAALRSCSSTATGRTIVEPEPAPFVSGGIPPTPPASASAASEPPPAASPAPADAPFRSNLIGLDPCVFPTPCRPTATDRRSPAEASVSPAPASPPPPHSPGGSQPAAASITSSGLRSNCFRRDRIGSISVLRTSTSVA